MSQSPTAPWIALAGEIAPFASMVVFAAPIPTIRQISKNKSVGSLPLLPYSSMVANAFVWVVYGLLIRERKVWSCNVVGLVLGSYYCYEFRKHVPKLANNLPGTVLQHAQAIVLIVTFTLMLVFGVTTQKAASLIGLMGVSFCTVLFGSPLVALRDVLKKKSARSIPWPFTIASLINCFLWCIVGILDLKDFNVYFPNVLGFVFTLAQVALKLIYGDERSGDQLPLSK